ncbi:DUF3293 domain-containing protein [Neoroseomonas lacus]|uniref:DUF3293 domain-containing protein n=1 Tax=Neoroseomonas lacus TaxID=287609 RepID=A0A917KCQ0_9PROT|nr:DUF3293 domain-containing protein [Neoroseomonas lacus]GGJ06237.1 hypothetical protein GCM10011320_11270 [Neoroseomonas lacus]
MSLPHVRFLHPAPLPVGPRLARGWRLTAYAAGGAAVRLGRRSAVVDALLTAAGVRQGAFIGAWNPLSRAMPRRWNDRALARLRGLAQRGGRRCIAGRGHAAKPPWAEDHLLMLGDLRPITVLARRFRQHAILRVRLRAASRLLVLR